MLFHRRPRIIGEGTCTTKQTASAHTVIVNQPLLEQIPQHRIFGKTLAGFYRLNALPCQPFNIVLPLASFCLNSFSRVTHAGDNFRDNLSRIIFLHHECLSSHPTYTVKALKGTYIAHDNQRNSLTLVELHPFLVKFTHTCWTSSFSGRARLLRDPTHQTLYAGCSMSVQFSIILTWQRDRFYQS